MHGSSYEGMRRILAEVGAPSTGRVVDLGSADVNGTYRPLLEGWEYVGVDIAPGPGVDAVMPGEYEMPPDLGMFDLLISGQCIEHVRNPFRLIAAAAELVRPRGLAIIIAPHRQRIHRYPIDTFRYNPDGMAAILEEAGFVDVSAWLGDSGGNIADCFGIGKKAG